MAPQSGRRAATIGDVATAAGVSRAAVSKVIRNAYGVSPGMRERVNAAIEQLDYRPSVAARALRGSSWTLGFETPGFGNHFFTRILNGASSALADSRYQLIIAPAEEDAREGYRAIEALADRQVDGLVAVSPLVDTEWLERLAGRLPLVMIGRHDSSTNYDTVVGDDSGGARAAMEHLLGLGHHAIAHLTRSQQATEPSLKSPHSIRLQVYEAAMQAAGFDRLRRIVRTEQSVGDAYQAAKSLLERPDRPTAVFAGNDQLALGALRAMADLDLTPDDVSVIGYDNIEIAGHPGISLTTIDQDGDEMGRQAIGMLVERLGGRTEARRFVAETRLIVRGSTAPALPHR